MALLQRHSSRYQCLQGENTTRVLILPRLGASARDQRETCKARLTQWHGFWRQLVVSHVAAAGRSKLSRVSKANTVLLTFARWYLQQITLQLQLAGKDSMQNLFKPGGLQKVSTVSVENCWVDVMCLVHDINNAVSVGCIIAATWRSCFHLGLSFLWLEALKHLSHALGHRLEAQQHGSQGVLWHILLDSTAGRIDTCQLWPMRAQRPVACARKDS